MQDGTIERKLYVHWGPTLNIRKTATIGFLAVGAIPVILCFQNFSYLPSETVNAAYALFPTPSIYSESVATSSGLPNNPTTDFLRQFTAPNGQVVSVLVRAPVVTAPVFTMMPYQQWAANYPAGQQPVRCYFRTAVHLALANGSQSVIIPQGTYNFEPSTNAQRKSGNGHWIIGNSGDNSYANCPTSGNGNGAVDDNESANRIHDLSIDLSGSTLNMPETGVNWVPLQGIQIINVDRIRLMNFIITRPHLRLASLGTIIAGTPPAHHQLLIDADYPVSAANSTSRIDALNVWAPSLSSNGQIGSWSGNADSFYPFMFPAGEAKYLGNQTFSCACGAGNDFDQFPIGTRMIARHYYYEGQAAISISWSNDVDIEQGTMMNVPGNAIQQGYGGGYRGLRIANMTIRRAPGQLISATAGGLNPGGAAMQGDLIVESSEIADGGDDAINIAAPLNPVAPNTLGSNIFVPWNQGDPDPFDFPVVGDTLAFFDQTTMQYLGTSSVQSVMQNSGANPTTLTLTVNPEIANLNSNSAFADLTQQGSGRFFIQGNHIHHNIGNGTLVSAPYGLIDSNQYAYNSHGVSLGGGIDEGVGATNVVISNNNVAWSGIGNPHSLAAYSGAIAITANTGEILSPSALFQKIIVANNNISNSAGEALLLSTARYVSITNNVINNTDLVPNPPYSKTPYAVANSSIGYLLLLTQVADVNVCGTSGTSANNPTGLALNITPASNVVLAPICP